MSFTPGAALNLGLLKASCSACSMHQLCLPMGLDEADINRLGLRMSREDIGNYLGLTIESISRLLSRFKRQGLLQVDKREVTLLEPARLKSMAAGTEQCSPME